MTRKQLSTMSIWLGLFAMLMIHAGPLFSAIQAAQAGVQHHHHAEHRPSAHDLGSGITPRGIMVSRARVSRLG